jgi:photosystem II stability/assembly factor-like uncharacterized protein
MPKRLFCLCFAVFFYFSVSSQNLDLSQFKDLKFRNIGPFRGGRSLAVAGHPATPNTFYFGAVGGGIWKTEDGGKIWHCVSDTVFKSSSVGALAIAPSDPKIIYAGMGETDIRGNISFGDGMYKSTNGGKKWQKIGLENTFAIANCVVHPKNPDIVYVSALGHVFKPNADRGVFRTKDGGKTWQKVLYKSDSAGCINIAMDPNNPDVLYASLWQTYRTPWSMSSGGRHSGLYKSVDGGNTWVDISKNEGLPKGILGKICIAVSPVNSDRVFAMVENTNGGLFRSDDAGETWQKITEEKVIKQRPWYFSGVYCHPKNQDIVFVLNVAYHKSTDGGKTFSTEWAQHADNHDMWINPENPDIMIIGNDGGGTVSYNGGLSWSAQDFPTAQFYHVVLDNQFPYHIYGAQQDNTSVGISSRSFGWEIGKSNWFNCSWGESGYIAPHLFNSKVAFGGNYSGAIYRYDRELGHTTMVNVYPDDGIGAGADVQKHRFQWTFPILFSPFSTKEKTILYATSQNVHRSYDEGLHWETISPDLTRNDKSKQQASGGPISKDNTGVEVFNTIFAFAESSIEKGILWSGSDDGLIHISRDDGKSWVNVTSTAIPENTQISIIEPSHFNKQKAYIAANRFKLGETGAYLLKTEDYGKTWKRIESGLPKNAVTRVIREDPAKEGLLFCGTETGLYISINDGESWQPFNQNLPNTPIHDLAIHPTEHDLVVATHGRGFWILDNLNMIYETIKKKSSKTVMLACRHTFNANGGTYYDADMQAGENAPCGMVIDYLLPSENDSELVIKIKNDKGDSIAVFSSTRDKNYVPVLVNQDFYQPKTTKPAGLLSSRTGFNRFVWDMKTADLVKLSGDGQIMWGASLSGPLANPDNYKIELYSGDSLLQKTQCSILPDPRFKEPSIENYKAKKQILDSVIAKVNQTHTAINQIRSVRKQINDFNAGLTKKEDRDTMIKLGKQINDSLFAIENILVQTKAKNVQDLLNYPIKLNNKLAQLIDKIDAFKGPVPQQYWDVYKDLSQKINIQLAKFESIKSKEIKTFNDQAKKLETDVIRLNK